MVTAATHTRDELEQALKKVTQERDTLHVLYQKSLETIRKLERGILGPKPEKLPNDAQLSMDILRLMMGETDAEVKDVHKPLLSDPDEPEEAQEKPRPSGRKRKPKSVPRIEIEILPAEVRLGGLLAYERIGEDTAEITEQRRGGTFVVCYRRPKFVRKDRKKSPSKSDPTGALPPPHPTVLVAPAPELPIERVSAGPALLARTVVQRFLDALPLHRMERIYAREGVPIVKSTLCGWHESLSELVVPLVDAMHTDALHCSAVLCTDATGVRVQAKDRCAVGHFFVVIAPLLHILFFYTKKHDSGAIDTILSGYSGHLVADAHTIHNNDSERQLRKEAIGRKNWLFLGTHEAGHINARFMSWPRNRVLELAPAYWKQTLEETDAQARLEANVLRRLSLDLDPL
ncbi:MAG: transposase [Myxococcales bacterium]|nr:transposase [Myxococcales bacterium]